MAQRVELELQTVENDRPASSDLRHFLRMLYRHKGKVLDIVGPSVILDTHPGSSPSVLQRLRDMLVAAQVLPELSDRDRSSLRWLTCISSNTSS